MAYFGVFATILLLMKNMFIYDFIYDFIDQLKKAYVYLVYIYAKTGALKSANLIALMIRF